MSENTQSRQSTPLEQNLAALRAVDMDRYLALLLMPETVRGDLCILMLFNAEISAIRDRVREPLAGEVRLQWWSDVLSGNRASEADAYPLASSLLEVINRHGLPVAPLIGMCEARIFDLYDDPMPDRVTYEGYAGETASSLLQLSAFLIDSEVSKLCATVSGHAGIAQAVAGHLMMLPLSRSRGQLYMPQDLLTATGLDRDGFLAGHNKTSIGLAINAFAGFGREHLGKARAALKELPPEIFAAYLPIAMVEQVLNRAEKAGAHSLETPVRLPQWRRQWALWRASRCGTI